MDAPNSPTQVIEDKIKFHRKRAEYHRQRAADWSGVLAQIQALQREEQPEGKSEGFQLVKPKAKRLKRGNKASFARKVLRSAKDGVLPVEVRKLANEQGYAVPNNYPYKIFKTMIERGEARKDQDGKYFPVGRESLEQNERATLQ